MAKKKKDKKLRFDGKTYVPERDGPRLFSQLETVKRLMSDGEWHTPAQIHKERGYPDPSIGARLRDFRKPKFGRYTIEKRYVGNHEYAYRMSGGCHGTQSQPNANH